MSKKKSSAAVAIVQAPAAPPAPATFEQRMRYARTRCEDARGERESYLADFRASIACTDPGTISHVLQWKSENVLRADAFLKHTRLLPDFLADVAGIDEKALDRHLEKPDDVAFVGDASAKFVAAIGCTEPEGVALGVAVLRLREELARIVRSLCGDGWGGVSSTGPWNHSSTSAMANTIASNSADAERQAYALLTGILDRIAGDVLP